MSTRHTEECIYTGQAERCDGSCVQHEEEKAA